MLNLLKPKSGKLILLLVGVFSLDACSRLVTPDQTTEITEVRAGQYALDPNHAALMFKLNHLGFSPSWVVSQNLTLRWILTPKTLKTPILRWSSRCHQLMSIS